MKKHVIIVAGGSGKRMGTDIPKQFLPLNGKAILMHTIDLFYKYYPSINIILVLPKNQIDYWKSLCTGQNFNRKHKIVEGGETRFYSVKNGLLQINDGLVAIHDGVRPFVSIDVISRLFNKAAESANAVPVISINESVRIVDDKTNTAFDRQRIKLVQTPQVFKTEEIKKAYAQDYKPDFTDDATVYESSGEKVCLVEGNKENIKITTSFDLLFAKALFNAKKA